MKATIVLFSLLMTTSLFASCQSSQTDNVKRVKHSKEEWGVFLKKFPTKKIQFLDSLKHYQHLKDTISIDLVNHFFWSDSIPSNAKRKDGKKYNVIKVAPSIYKGYEFLFPCCGNQEKGILMRGAKNKKGEVCDFYGVVYPLAKVLLPNENIMVLYSWISAGEVFYRVTVEIINKDFEKTGHWGFLYGADWKYCDDSIFEMGKTPTPYSYPVKIRENGFEVIDEIIESEFKEEILQTIWSVEINTKGQFEILKERKIYEDKEELWPKYGYFIKDKDGYCNLRVQPNNGAKIIEKLQNGSSIEILNAKNDWWQVKITSGKIGYIHKSRIVYGVK